MPKTRTGGSGKSAGLPLSTVRREVLVTKPYTYSGKRDIEVTITQPEFTSLCPMTGLPDFGTLTVVYTPAGKIIELKSLKLYLLQYRQVGIFYEHLINRIIEDLIAAVEPAWMEVRGEFTARGGITTTVAARYEEET
jgi:7-cyano-7-deazaguanine reductase